MSRLTRLDPQLPIMMTDYPVILMSARCPCQRQCAQSRAGASTAAGGVPLPMAAHARIFGQDQIDTFRAMCALAGRRPHELAADIVLEAILQARHDHEVQHLTVCLPGRAG
jgi:hypothetical protein